MAVPWVVLWLQGLAHGCGCKRGLSPVLFAGSSLPPQLDLDY